MERVCCLVIVVMRGHPLQPAHSQARRRSKRQDDHLEERPGTPWPMPVVYGEFAYV